MKKKLDLVGICETWLDDSVSESEIAIPDFSIIHKDRCNIKAGRGGGVLLYVRRSISCCAGTELNKSNTETVWVKLFENQKNEICIGVAYRSQSAAPAEVLDLHSVIRKASHGHVLNMGDFNYPSINWNILDSDLAGGSFFDLVQNCFLVQHVLTPTRGNNILYLVFSSEDGMVTNICVQEHLANSDHNIITFVLVQEFQGSSSNLVRYDFHKANYELMSQYLRGVNWESELDQTDVNSMWSRFVEIISVAIETYTPVSKRGVSKRPCWMTRATAKPRNRKAKMWKRYCQSRSYNDLFKYKRVLNKTTAVYKSAKLHCELGLVREIKTNPKSFYSYVRSKARTRDKVGPLKDKSGKVITDEKSCVMN